MLIWHLQTMIKAHQSSWRELRRSQDQRFTKHFTKPNNQGPDKQREQGEYIITVWEDITITLLSKSKMIEMMIKQKEFSLNNKLNFTHRDQMSRKVLLILIKGCLRI